MYFHHIIGFSSKALGIFYCKSAINKIAYGGANFLPIAVPRIKSFLIEFKFKFNSLEILLIPKIVEEKLHLHIYILDR